MAAAENYVMCLIGAMDRLWFHQIILFSQPSLFHLTEDAKKPTEASDYSSKNTFQTSLISDPELSSTVITAPQNSSPESDDLDRMETTNSHEERERPVTRLNVIPGKTRSRSSSPISSQKKSRNLPRLQKTMSCKSLLELELEEVQGFMDLGFIFRKENLSNHIMNLIPGLQRDIDDSYKYEENNNDDDDIEKGQKKHVKRPYLSEAWIIRRPDSPLLNLRIPRVSTSADMKKHLKYWAQTVAFAVQQES